MSAPAEAFHATAEPAAPARPSAESAAAGKLRTAAGGRNILPEARDALNSLAHALATGDDVDSWAAVDLRAAFSPEAAVAPSATVVWLGRLLEVLVFVPIGITWLGLMAATQAYRETLHDKSLAAYSFLQRWQLGFAGKLPGWLSFDQIAIYTFTVIAVVVALAVAHFGFRSWSEQRPQARAYQKLAVAVTAAEQALAPVKLGVVGRVATELGKVSAEVAGTASAIREVGEAVERTQQAATDGLAAMGETIEKIAVATAAVQAAAGEVGQAAVDMGDHLAAATAAAGAVADTEAEFADKLQAATEKLDATVAGLADRLTTAVSSGQTQLSRAVADSTEKVAESLSESAGQVRRAVDELKATAADGASKAGTAVASLGDVRDAARSLPAVLDRLDGQVGSLNEGISRLTASISSMRIPAPAPVSYRPWEGREPAGPPSEYVPAGDSTGRDGAAGPVAWIRRVLGLRR